MRDDPKIGDVLGCVAYSPCSLEPHHPDLFWYGIHGVENAVHDHGPGLRLGEPRAHGRHGRGDRRLAGRPRGHVPRPARRQAGLRGRGVRQQGNRSRAAAYGGYEPLLVEIAKFFQTGKPPVSAEETLEILAFMEAADESKRQNGAGDAGERDDAGESGELRALRRTSALSSLAHARATRVK